MSASTSDWAQQLLAGLDKGAADAAAGFVGLLLKSFGQGTEPDLHTIVPTYDTMLGIALLMAASVIALAIIERILGGRSGAGLSVIPRVLACSAVAGSGLFLVQYATRFAADLGSVWNPAYAAQAQIWQREISLLPSLHLSTGYEAGTAIVALVVAGLTLLIAVFVYLELIVRSALILVTTVFLPFVVVMGIWPRLASATLHLGEFLGALLLSKFFIATAIYVGFSLVASQNSGPDALMSGLAILFMAAFAPVALFRGLRFTHAGGAVLSRSWSSRGARAGAVMGAVALTGAQWAVSRARPRAVRWLGSRRTERSAIGKG